MQGLLGLNGQFGPDVKCIISVSKVLRLWETLKKS